MEHTQKQKNGIYEITEFKKTVDKVIKMSYNILTIRNVLEKRGIIQ
jgi:hypothetical protein